MSGHTPEPWEAFPPGNPTEIKTEFGSPSVDMSELIPVMRLSPGKNKLANAERIVDCVNEFAGIDKVNGIVGDIKNVLETTFETLNSYKFSACGNYNNDDVIDSMADLCRLLALLPAKKDQS